MQSVMTAASEETPMSVPEVLDLFRANSNPFTRALEARVHVAWAARENWLWVEREMAKPVHQVHLSGRNPGSPGSG
jgi:hypothetical protein